MGDLRRYDRLTDGDSRLMTREPTDMLLTDAELVLGLSRHLSAYAGGSAKAELEQLEFAGQILDMAFRLRGSGTNTPERVAAIGVEAGIGRRTLREVLGVLDTLGWVSVQRNEAGRPISVAELIPSASRLVSEADKVMTVVGMTLVERAALAVLRATTIQPLLVTDALDVGVAAAGNDAAGELAATDGLRHLSATGLAKRVTAADGREVVFNPNVWVGDSTLTEAALRAADARATTEVAGLLQEIAESPGMPETHVTSTEKRWIDFAVSQGLAQRSLVQTADGAERGFLFTPHLARDPFGKTVGDASGQVRQLVGSMIYAATFADYKLVNPAAFIRRLVNYGEAGNASPIGTDYPMLETAGIVRVVPGSSQNRFRLELLQSDVAEDALRILDDREETLGDPDGAAALRAQRSYVHVERERAQLAKQLNYDAVEQQRLIAALRDEAVRRTFRNPS